MNNMKKYNLPTFLEGDYIIVNQYGIRLEYRILKNKPDEVFILNLTSKDKFYVSKDLLVEMFEKNLVKFLYYMPNHKG